MKRNGIIVKLWIGIVAMTIAILLLTLVFQTEFLYAFYYDELIKQLERNGTELARYIATQDYDYTIPYDKAIRNINDVIIVTDHRPLVTYTLGDTDYKIGYPFGIKFIDQIMEGKPVHAKVKVANNNIKKNIRDGIIVGVPIKNNIGNIINNRHKRNDAMELADDSDADIIGAVYIISPLDTLETTINAIRLQFLYILAGAIFAASLISFLLSRSFSRPLIQINNVAKEIAKGNYNATIDLKSSEEIKTLGDTINDLGKQLSRVEQIRREFIANVSHELRTPLSYVQGYTEIMLDGLAETEEDKQKYLEIIAEETIRLKKMVDEILELSQIEAEQIQLKMTHFSIDLMIKRTIDKIYPIASKRYITIKYNNASDDILLCLGDESRLKQVLINLLNNAVKHSYDYGNIVITAYREGEKIFIGVRDFGEGIPEEDLPFIWDRFYTVDKVKSENSTGLGLSIVKSILQAHGTEITVNSIMRQGTEFCFWLPSYTETTEV